ncbi:MAG: hypothetical protein ACXW1Z_19450 [Methylobacter sp.]
MDSKQLKDAALCALKFIEIYSGRDAKTLRYKALKAISISTVDDLGKGKSGMECRYTAFHIFHTITGKNSFEDSDKRNVNRYLTDLHENLPKHNEMLKQIAIENSLTAIPSYDFGASTGIGSGNYSEHFITPVALDLNEINFSSEKPKVGEIKYYLESITNLPFLFKWVNNFELSEWRKKTLVALLCIALITVMCLYLLFILVFMYSTNGGLEIVRALFGILGISTIIILPIRQLYLCLTNRIIQAPILLQPSDNTNAQVEYISTNKISETTGKVIRKFRVVSYSSICPLCNSRIEVENGGREFHNRLVGRCLEAPLEHVYSFDRVLCVGHPLRSR